MGVVGDPKAASMVYFGLYALQHRGQESCGIAANQPVVRGNDETLQGEYESVTDDVPSSFKMSVHKDFGLVSDTFCQDILNGLVGHQALGHVRYATAESGIRENIQPFCFSISGIPVALTHNGNVTNARRLRAKLEAEGSVFTTTSDTEVVVHLMARSQAETFEGKICEAIGQLMGGFVFAFLANDTIYALRDRHGLRPLVLGKKDDVYMVASESCALDLLDATFEREISPGELVALARGKEPVSKQILPQAVMSFCSFEPIYFSRPDSWCGQKSVYDIRKNIGAVLASLYPVKADLVVAVPDSAMPIAIGYAAATGIPLELGMIRNHYIGRTFIEPSQTARDLGVKLKLNALESVLAGRDCVVIDDSIVRGTTSLKIVKMLKKAGAGKIHFRVGSPPVTHSCHYGISTPDRKKLMAAQIDVEAMLVKLEVDSLGYMTRKALSEALGGVEHIHGESSEESESKRKSKNESTKKPSAISYCMACFSGAYPVKIDHPAAYKTHPTDKEGCGFYAVQKNKQQS